MSGKLDFAELTIGGLISQKRMMVPPNQRAYAWRREPHVRDLLQDLRLALDSIDQEEYFLGTVVLVQPGKALPQIADGQQRLATTSILLARCVDLFRKLKRGPRAQSTEEQFIRKIDKKSEQVVPHLTLNEEDNAFYKDYILLDMCDPKNVEIARSNASFPSNRRLLEASEEILDYLKKYLEQYREDTQADQLLRWVDFIEERASVVVVTVPDDVGAFRMFETLNDRGLKASQADVLKNYLFSKSGSRFQEARSCWNVMSGALATLPDDDDDNLVSYIRYYWITQNGVTRVKELAKSIKDKVQGEQKAMEFLGGARDGAKDYVALWTPGHEKWNAYKPSTRKRLHTLTVDLKVEQIIPLLFAVAVHFTPNEADKAFKLLVSWSVRFLIAGAGKAGRLDTPYSERAQMVGTGQIKTARDLRDSMSRLVPDNREFEAAFAEARVSKTFLARYYLRAIESTMRVGSNPEFVPNQDQSEINLEHVLPIRPSKGWMIDPDTAEDSQKLLGNMVLLSATKNVALGNASFSDKWSAYFQSDYLVTKQVSELVAQQATWGLEEIKQRQKELAKVAVRTWSLDFLDHT